MTEQYNKPKFRMRGLWILWAAIILVLIGTYMFATYRYQYRIFFEREKETMLGNYQNIRENYHLQENFRKEINRMINQKNMAQLEMSLFDITTMTEEALNQELAKFQSGDFEYRGEMFIVDREYHINDEYAENPFELNEEQLKQLLQDGQMVYNGRCYSSMLIDDVYCVLVTWKESFNLDGYDYEMPGQISYLIWDIGTEKIMDYSAVLPENIVNSGILNNPKEIIAVQEDETVIGREEIDGKDYLFVAGNVTEEEKKIGICIITEDGESHRKALFGAVYAGGLALLLVVSCVFISIRLHKKRYSSSVDSNGTAIRHFHSFRRQMTEMYVSVFAAFFLVAGFLFSIENVMQLMNEVNSSLTNTFALEENMIRNQNTIDEVMKSSLRIYAEDIAYSLRFEHTIDTETLLKNWVHFFEVKEISVYDKDGIEVHSSDMYIGYPLSNDESNQEYQFWKILNGSAENISYISEKDGCTYLGIRRYDEVGIIMISADDKVLGNITKQNDFGEIIKRNTYSKAGALYFSRSNPKSLYYLEPEGTRAVAITNVLPIAEEGERCIVTRVVNGSSYLIVGRAGTGWIAAIAYPMREMWINNLWFLSMSGVVYVMLILLSLLIRVEGVPDQSFTGLSPEIAYNAFGEERKKSFCVVLSLLSLAILSALLVGNLFFGGISFFELTSQWEKGLNLITISYVIGIAVIFAGIMMLLRSLSNVFEKILTPKRYTIITLIFTLGKVSLVVCFLVIALEQLGANTIAIASSLGLAGLSLSIGSKDMISDLVAGLCIAFEGQLQIGDRVQVSGFTGRIVSMGIRTTKIRNKNQEFIVNNTNIKNAINYSRGLSKVSISITLSYQTDIDALERLINDSSQRFLDVCEGKLLEKLKFEGVNDCTSRGIECLFIGISKEIDVNECTLKCRRELLRILSENGLIPHSRGNTD